MQAIIHRHNRLSLDQNGDSPLEKFTGTRDDCLPTEYHTWGCPTFILDAPNQSSTIGTPKWNPKSHTGIYLGHSPCHAGSVALVLNLKTGLVSPQFHVVFDENFTTVPYLSSIAPPPNWTHLLQHSTEKTTIEAQQLSYKWLHPDVPDNTPDNIQPINHPNVTDQPSPSLPGEHQHKALEPNSQTSPTPPSTSETNSSTLSKSAGEDSADHTTFVNVEQIGLRRSPRLQALKSRQTKYGLLATVMLAASNMTTVVAEAVTHCY